MKKIGILTFHRATNYGAILQAYALVQYLRKEGYDAKIVDYKPKGMALLYAPINVPGIFKKFKRVVLNLIMLSSLHERYKKRKMFWNYISNVLPMTEKIIGICDVPKMDAFIVGSDQVWSVCFTGGLDPLYWGLFEKYGARMISYAGSAAENMNESFYSNSNAKLLKSFDYISVREDELQKHLQQALPNKDIEKVLDPTLMVGVECFEKLVKCEEPLGKPYILVYQVVRTKDRQIQDYAKWLSGKNGWDIVEIYNSRLHRYSNGVLTISDSLVTPTQFVSLFKYAQFIITTSFHGTAFSLLFNRPFIVVSISEAVDSRAKDILSQLGIIDRLVNLPVIEPLVEIDWDQTNKKLSELRIPSRQFLKKALTDYGGC